MNDREKGAALPIVAVILAGIGLTVAATTIFTNEERQTRQETAARPALDDLADALVSYYKVAGALPCPADAQDADGLGNDCNVTAARAVVPWRTLGLGDGLDPWGQQIGYRPLADLDSDVTEATPLTTGDAMTVCQDRAAPCTLAAPGADDAAFVIFSHGRPRTSAINGNPVGNGAFDALGNPNELPANGAEIDNIGTAPSDGVEYFALPRTAPNLMGGDPTDDDPVRAFEQILEWRTVADLGAATDPPPPPTSNDDYDLDLNEDTHHDQFVTTPDKNGGNDETQPAALGERQGDDKNWVGIGNNNNDDRVGRMQSNRALCAWYPKAMKWERGETMRGSLVFQFAPGESDPNEDQNFGGGFTLTFVPGPRRVSQDNGTVICGQDNDDGNMGLGYKAGTLSHNNAYYDPTFDWNEMLGGEPARGTTGGPMRMPKMAIEFDIFNNEYGDEKNLKRNHVAILSTWDTEYIGNGSGNNPDCPTNYTGLNTDASAEDPSVPQYGTDARACTYDGTLASWMEKVGKGNKDNYPADWYVSNTGAAPYAARFEVARLCDEDCSDCGIAPPDTYTTNTQFKAGRDRMWMRVWVEKVEDLATDKFLTDLSQNLWNVDGYDSGNTPAKFINYCGPDPSMQFQSNDINGPSFRKDMVMFDTIKVGITAAGQTGKGGKGMAASITDLRVKLAQ